MIINIKDKSTGAIEIPVKINKHLKDMTLDEIIEKYNIYNDLIDYHYYVCQEYKNTDDVASDEMIEHIAEKLYEEVRDEDYDYDKLSKEIMDKLEDELIKDIISRDEEARDYYETVNEALKGAY